MPASLLQRLGLPADTRAVVIAADDLGMCHASTAGRLDALQRGVATTASLMGAARGRVMRSGSARGASTSVCT